MLRGSITARRYFTLSLENAGVMIALAALVAHPRRHVVNDHQVHQPMLAHGASLLSPLITAPSVKLLLFCSMPTSALTDAAAPDF
jgi:hypothetical protein